MTEATEILTAAMPAEGLVADINRLFAERHALGQMPVNLTEPGIGTADIFVEQVDGSKRTFVNLSEQVRAAADAWTYHPHRAKGTTRVMRTAHFLDLIRTAKEPVLVQVASTLERGGIAATAILNPTLPDGTPGHQDHAIVLEVDTAPAGAAWLHAAIRGQGMSLEAFQQLIYSAGHVVAHPQDWPADTTDRIKRLGLNGLEGLASLLAASPGIELIGDAEASLTVDAATGARAATTRDLRVTRTAFPTAIVIQWEPLPGLSYPVALRVFIRKGRDGAEPTWFLQPLDFVEQGREAASDLASLLTVELTDFAPGAHIVIGAGQHVASV